MKTKAAIKILSMAAAFCMAAAVSAPAAFAASDTRIDNQGNDTVTISGKAGATVVRATVTLSAPFEILPNEPEPADRFVSPTIRVANQSTVPFDLSVKSLRHNGDSPAVVAPDKYNDGQWAALGKAATKANIALGLQWNGTDSAADTNVTAKSYWFPEESKQNEARFLKQLAVGETLEMTMQAKHGLVWEQDTGMSYDMVFGISLPE